MATDGGDRSQSSVHTYPVIGRAAVVGYLQFSKILCGDYSQSLVDVVALFQKLELVLRYRHLAPISHSKSCKLEVDGWLTRDFHYGKQAKN